MDIAPMIIAEAVEQALEELRGTGVVRLGRWELCAGPYSLYPDDSEGEKYTLAREATDHWERVSTYSHAAGAVAALVQAWQEGR